MLTATGIAPSTRTALDRLRQMVTVTVTVEVVVMVMVMEMEMEMMMAA